MNFVITLLTLIMLMGAGCTHQVHQAPLAPRLTSKPSRCVTIGKAATSNVVVMVERNCLKNGVTTVSILVLKPKNKKLAAKEGAQLILRILKFRPKLAILFYGKTKGMPFFLTVVTGSND